MSYQSAKRVAASYVDPAGYLSEDEHAFYRTIVADKAFYTEQVFGFDAVQELLQKGQLVSTHVSEKKSDVLEHQKISPVTYCTDWCFEMLKDACLHTLAIQMKLLESDLELKDCYPWNVVFDGCKPVFVDFTSIIKTNPKRLWDPYIQVVSFFYRPLLLASYGKKEIARALLKNFVSGVSSKELLNYLPMKHYLLHPLRTVGMYTSFYFEQYVDGHHETKRKIVRKINASRMTFSKQQKIKFCKKLIRMIEKIDIPLTNTWKKYYKKQDAEGDVAAELKTKTIDEICQKLQFKSAMDIGCNTGRFTNIAAKYAKTVIALDSSEDCVETVYAQAKENHKQVLPLVVDYANPQSAYGFGGKIFNGFFSRAQADLVLFLGIMHHIHITCRQSFPVIIEHLAQVTQKYLVFEFVGADDKNNMLISNGREITYSKQSVMNELQKYFDVDVVDSDRDTRKLFVCTKK